MDSYPTYRPLPSVEAPPWLPWNFFRPRVHVSPMAEKSKRGEGRSPSEVPQLVIKQLLRPVFVKHHEEQLATDSSRDDNFLTDYLTQHALTTLPPGELIHRITLPPGESIHRITLPPVSPIETKQTPTSHRRVVSSVMSHMVPEANVDDLFQEVKPKPRVTASSLERRPKTHSVAPLRMEVFGSRTGTPVTDIRRFNKSSLSPIRKQLKQGRGPVKIPQPKTHRKFASLDATTQSIRLQALPVESSSDSLSSSGHLPPIAPN